MRIYSRRNWEIFGVCALLVVLVFLVFGQTLHHGFVNFDDGEYVYENPVVSKGLSFAGIGWAFTHVLSSNWHPLTTISHMLDCWIYGLNPWGHHLGNVLLHTVSVVLLFLMLRELTGAFWRCAVVAALFAIHPLRVESVAWVAERKDVLSGLFFMLTLRAYACYARRPDSKGRYAMVAVWLALGLMSKPMLVTVPFVLLLLDYWPLGRFQGKSQLSRLLREKLPFFALSALSCVATVIAQKGSMQQLERFPLSSRLGNAMVAYVVYLGKLIYPAGLAVSYPLLKKGWPVWQVGLATLLLMALTAGAFILRRKQPFLLVGWLWYLGMLVPVIGLLQVGVQAYADRYTYLPQIGLCVAATWAAADWVGERRRLRLVFGSMTVAALCVLSMVAFQQASYWRESVTLWNHALECDKDIPVAHNNLGIALAQQGRTGEAITEYREALAIIPDYAGAHNNLANALLQQGQTEEGIAEYRKALRINPGFTQAHSNLGNVLVQQGRVEEAISEYHSALRINPEYEATHNGLGFALARQGRMEEAIAEYHTALRINPNYTEALNNLGFVLSQQGRTEEAIAEYQLALRINPDYAPAHNSLGLVLARQGRTEEAVAEYHSALRINPDYAEAHNNLGHALAQQGRMEEADAHYREAIRINPELRNSAR